MNDNRNPVVVSGIDIPFLNLVTLLIKLALASIPAALLLGFFFLVIGLVLSAVFGGLGFLLK